MSDDQKQRPERRPLGERSEDERSRPFGSRAPGERRTFGAPRERRDEDEKPRRPATPPPPDQTQDDDQPPVFTSRIPAEGRDPHRRVFGARPSGEYPWEKPSGDDQEIDSSFEAPPADATRPIPRPPLPEDRATIDDEPRQVPLVRIRAEDIPDIALPYEGEDDDNYAPRRPEPTVRGEPSNAPALIRVRDRRGKIPGDSSILKKREEPEPEPEPEPEVTPSLQFGVILRSMGGIFLAASIVATIFTWWTPNTFLPADSVDQLSVALATQSSVEALPQAPSPTSEPTPTSVPAAPLQRIGIVSGHAGIYPATGLPDPGAVCDDGLTEEEVNASIASRVVTWLQEAGYEVDLLDEWDPRLSGYQASVMLSIHADSCEFINDAATGFKVASFAESSAPEEDARLVQCLVDRYSTTTGMTFHPSVTYDMTQYHNFREVAPGTPGAIIEVGFLYLDRDMLTQQPDVVALGVARGLLCYLRNESVGN